MYSTENTAVGELSASDSGVALARRLGAANPDFRGTAKECRFVEGVTAGEAGVAVEGRGAVEGVVVMAGELWALGDGLEGVTIT